jgi:hypothetical protein
LGLGLPWVGFFLATLLEVTVEELGSVAGAFSVLDIFTYFILGIRFSPKK